VRQAWGERDWECGLNQAGGVLASSGLKSLWKTDEKQVSLVLIGEEEFRFFLWNKLHSVGDCQGPHCAPEIRSVKVCWGGGMVCPGARNTGAQSRDFAELLRVCHRSLHSRGVVGAAL